MTRKLFKGLLAIASFTLLLSACGDSAADAQPQTTNEVTISEEELTEMKKNIEYLEQELETAKKVKQELEEELKSLNP